MIAGVVTGQCVNHHCGRFEFLVPAHEGARCDDCGQLLLAPNGVDYAGTDGTTCEDCESEHPLAPTLRADEDALD